MTHTVHQHWDPLKVCAVGRSFPPEFYRKIDNPKVRSVMERIAIETEEDYQELIKILEKFKRLLENIKKNTLKIKSVEITNSVFVLLVDNHSKLFFKSFVKRKTLIKRR